MAEPRVETQTLARRRFDVWNEVPLVPQTTGMSCWAAAAAMIIGWRDKLLVDPPEVARGAGTWQSYAGGLHPGDVASLARAWGLTEERRETWTPEALRRILERHGPVWLGEASPGLHSVVVAGMHGDGTPDGTWVRINDPWPVGRGERYTLPWRQLVANYRAASDLIGVQAHVLHAGGRRGSSRSSVRETRVTRSRITHPPIPGPEEPMTSNGNGRRPHPEAYASVYGSPQGAATAVAAGERYLNTSAGGGAPDPLRAHGGSGENLYLVWNDVPGDIAHIDVVVHLHGYQGMDPNTALTRHKARMSGLRLDGRSRPTLGIMPRGRQASPAEVARGTNPARYTFEALTSGNGAGLEALVAWALGWFAREVLHRGGGAAPDIARMILTAHSGGGEWLNRLVAWRATHRVCNPDEVHTFDALYGSQRDQLANLENWARERISADRAAAGAPGGGCRILYRDGTRPRSLEVARAFPPAGDPLQPAYRAEATTVDHDPIPATFGPALLQDVRANLALAPSRPAARAHSADDYGEYVEDAEPAYGYPGAAPGYGYVAALAVDDDVRAWLAARPPTDRAPLAASVAAWIADTARSGIELMADAAQRRHFLSEVDWTQVDFSGNGRNRSRESEALFRAMTGPVPERRVTRIRFHDVTGTIRPVPGQTSHRLHPEARDAFVRMRDAARAQGVSLVIGSSFRSVARQREIAAGNTNPAAVAQGISAHSYGLAVDLLLSTPALAVGEIRTGSMPNMVAMYRTPAYKWMALHAREFDFHPYRREPWHWEYNPVGFAERFEREAPPSAQAHTYGAPLGLFERYPGGALDAAPAGRISIPRVVDVRDRAALGLQAAPRDWPRVSADDRILYVMERLVNEYHFPVNGAAGLVGNLWAESGLLPSRIEGSAAATPLRAPAFGGGTRDFTADEVMNRDAAAQRGPRLPGIGLAQWTAAARRAGLFRHPYRGRAPGSDILFDMDAQVDYLVTELQRAFAGVHRLLTRAGVMVNDASDEVVYRFEVPGSVLHDGALLPRTDARVQAVFATRRDSAARALRVYRAAHPAASVVQAAPATDWCRIRAAIASTARAEERRWTRPNGSKILENEASQLPILQQYWQAVPGFSSPAAALAQAQGSAADNDLFAWSAAFICHVMRTAGVTPAHGFNFGGAHIHYMVGALRNRERSDTAKPFWLLDEIEIVNEVTVEPGDLICMNRLAGGQMTNHSYSSLRDAFWGSNPDGGRAGRTPSGSSHCTLVVGIGQDARGRFAETIGGNEGDSVRLNHSGRIAINANGGIETPAAHHIFGLIKLMECRA